MIKCKICGEFFNPALLSQVIEHEHKTLELKKEYYGKEIDMRKFVNNLLETFAQLQRDANKK